MLERDDGGKSKKIFNIDRGNEKWICNSDLGYKKQSTVSVIENNPRRVISTKRANKKMIAAFCTKTIPEAVLLLKKRQNVTIQNNVRTKYYKK